MMENQSQRYRRRLVVVTAPFHGHLTPMLQLATVLHSKGFSITIAHTLFNAPNPSDHPHFLFLPISDGLSHNDYISSLNLTTIASALNTNCVTPLRELLLQMTKENNENIACIIYDGLMYFTDSVAQELNLPSLVLRTTSATNVLAYHALRHHLQADIYLPLQDDRSRDLVVPWPELEPLRFKDLPILSSPNSNRWLESLNRTLGVKPSLGVIYNTVDYLEGQYLDQLRQQCQVPIFSIGPFHINVAQDSSSSFLKQDYSCIAWLNKQAPRSVLYVSLGSIATWDERELTEMACGLGNSKQHFLWVVRARTITVPEWIQSLPEDVRKTIEERGFIVTWAPQKDVLAHEAVGGFWSHCGWNSTLESLCEGKPMICQPHFGDQTVNSRLVCHVWKVGVEWSNVIQRDEIEKAVRRLMVDHEGKEMLQRAREMMDEIRQAVREDGSSHNALIKLVEHIVSPMIP